MNDASSGFLEGTNGTFDLTDVIVLSVSDGANGFDGVFETSEFVVAVYIHDFETPIVVGFYSSLDDG